jgi:putative salt-induced outer membrane protein YdiY
MHTRLAATTLLLRFLALLLPALLCLATPARADELRLLNGDRLTGRVVTLAGGTLTFATPHGPLAVPWADVAALAVDEPLLVTLTGGSPASTSVGLSAEAGRVTLQPGGDVPLATITTLARPEPAIVWNGGANAGFVSAAGNSDINSLRVDGDVVARAAANRYTASAAVTRSEDRDMETARNWSASLKYDRFVSPRLFLNSNAILTNDRFRDLDLRTALGAGVGYQILQAGRVTLTADAGLGWVHENLEAGADDRYTAVRESAALTVTIVPDRVQFFHGHDGYFGITGDDNLFVRTQNGVRISVAAGFVTTVRGDLDYDRSPAAGRSNTDRTFSLTLGYRF